jgi:hypothetical protein
LVAVVVGQMMRMLDLTVDLEVAQTNLSLTDKELLDKVIQAAQEVLIEAEVAVDLVLVDLHLTVPMLVMEETEHLHL